MPEELRCYSTKIVQPRRPSTSVKLRAARADLSFDHACGRIPGDIFGVENGEVHRFAAEAILDTTVWIAKRRSLFAGLAKGDIPTAKKVWDLIARSLEHVENHLLLLGCQTALEKVAAFLAEMDRRLGQPPVIVLPMNRRDIADYLGLTPETVARALSILRDEGVLSFIGQTQRKIVLHDRAGLARHVT